jgi:aspartate/methionine/tyrosine aminotransferase
MKAAWIAVNGPEAPVAQALSRLEIIADTYLSLNTPIQLALPAFLASRTEFQKQMAARVAANLKSLDEALAAAPAVTRLEADGGWCAVLQVPEVASDEELGLALLAEQGTVVHPGHFYDFSGEGHLVLSLIGAPAVFRAGADKLASFLGRRFR